jgi:hypothetical protein
MLLRVEGGLATQGTSGSARGRDYAERMLTIFIDGLPYNME